MCANRLLQGLGIRLQGVIIGVEDRLIIFIVQLNQISYGPLESHGLRIIICCSMLGLIILGGWVVFKRGLLVVRQVPRVHCQFDGRLCYIPVTLITLARISCVQHLPGLVEVLLKLSRSLDNALIYDVDS